jgi:hypothetical protein
MYGTHDGSMVLLYMVLHGSHQYTPNVSINIPAPFGSVMGSKVRGDYPGGSYVGSLLDGTVQLEFRKEAMRAIPHNPKVSWRTNHV